MAVDGLTVVERRLVENVQVGGSWFGPDYPDAEVTDAVAAQIRNPAAWADGDVEPDAGPEPRRLVSEPVEKRAPKAAGRRRTR